MCGHKVDSVLLIMGMINCEGRALELLRLIFSTRGVTPPQGLERQHSFEAKPQPNYIKVGVAIILSRRRIHLAAISETPMPRSLTFRPIFLALLWVNRSLGSQIYPIYRILPFRACGCRITRSPLSVLLVVTRVHMPRDGNGLSGVGRTRDLPQKVLQDWMASNLFTKKSAQSIFAAVEAYAAARGYSPREATDLRHQLTPRMITFAAGQVVGKRVVRIKH